MDTPPPQQVTQLLQRIRAGEDDAKHDFYAVVYEELRRLAHRAMGHERESHTLQTTAIVHEAFMRLLPMGSVAWGEREQFFRAAAGTMRRILVDHARKRRAKKRSGGDRVALDHILETYEQHSMDVLAVDEALEHLMQVDEQLARVVELRFFAGLSVEETARVLGLSVSSIERFWRLARAWLRIELEE